MTSPATEHHLDDGAYCEDCNRPNMLVLCTWNGETWTRCAACGNTITVREPLCECDHPSHEEDACTGLVSRKIAGWYGSDGGDADDQPCPCDLGPLE